MSITNANGDVVLACTQCRTKARKGVLVQEFRGARAIVIDGVTRDPRIQIAQQAEAGYSIAGIRTALEAESDPWRVLAILNERLVDNENTWDRLHDIQQFRQLFIDRLIAMPTDGDLHVLVQRGNTYFHYDSRGIEQQVRDARHVDHVVQSQIMEEPDLWPEPVDGTAVADAMVETYHRHVKLTAEAIDAAVLWCFFTHSIDSFDIAPILGVSSPTHQCGKTTFVMLTGRFCHRRLSCSNISPSAIYRGVEQWHPTLLIDEGDTFLTENEEMRGILDSGHTRETAFVIRSGSSNESHMPRSYSTWCPKLLALIGRLPATLDDRAIKIKLQRMRPSDDVEKLRRHHLIALRPIHRRLARWIADHHDALNPTTREPIVLDELDARAQDNWDPLLFLADLLGGTWPERARRAARALSGVQVRANETAAVELLADIRRYFSRDQLKTKAFTPQLLAWLTEDDERPWVRFDHGKSLNARILAEMLKPFGTLEHPIQPHMVRIGGATGKGYDRDDFEEAFSRYLPPLPPSPSETPPQPSHPSQPAPAAGISSETDQAHPSVT